MRCDWCESFVMAANLWRIKINGQIELSRCQLAFESYHISIHRHFRIKSIFYATIVTNKNKYFRMFMSANLKSAIIIPHLCGINGIFTHMHTQTLAICSCFPLASDDGCDDGENSNERYFYYLKKRQYKFQQQRIVIFVSLCLHCFILSFINVFTAKREEKDGGKT